MTLEEIFDSWTKDAHIDRTALDNAALDIPKLHNKYYRMLSTERQVLRKMETNYSVLNQNKRAWANGTMSQEELKELGWSPHLKSVLKNELDEYLKADPDMIKFKLRLSLQEEKVDVLDGILKMVSNRSFQLSNAINFMKFQAGM